MIRLLSNKNRPVHLGPYPLERLKRAEVAPDPATVPPMPALSFRNPDNPKNLANAMHLYAVLMDALRDGPVRSERAEITSDLEDNTLPVTLRGRERCCGN